MTESDRIIAETLHLDAEATKGPWMHDDEAHYIVGGQVEEIGE